MRIGFAVDGESESQSIPLLFPALRLATEHDYLLPVVAKVSPAGPIGPIVRAFAMVIRPLEVKRLDRVIVLIDRENRGDCCPTLASALRTGLATELSWHVDLKVVIKDSTFENWLVADLAALAEQPGRFRVGRSERRAVEPNKADGADAINLLKKVAVGRSYDKVKDSRRILERANPLAIAANSRSFRCLLHCVGHPNYQHQSRQPAIPER